MLYVAPFAFLRRNEGVGDSAEGRLLGFDFRRRFARLDRIKPRRDLSPALARQFSARARLTLPAEPSPISRRLPSFFHMKSQERAPDRVTLRYSPSPSEWRPGWAMVATALAESFLTAFPMSSLFPTRRRGL
jgi:hypothetical protein